MYLWFVEPEDGSEGEISSFDARYFKRVKEGIKKKKNGDFTLFVECKVFFES